MLAKWKAAFWATPVSALSCQVDGDLFEICWRRDWRGIATLYGSAPRGCTLQDVFIWLIRATVGALMAYA